MSPPDPSSPSQIAPLQTTPAQITSAQTTPAQTAPAQTAPPFTEVLTRRTRQLNTRLCLGLDPRLEVYSAAGDPQQARAALRAHTLAVLEACAPHVACVKPQLAFYEALGLWGLTLLEELCRAARALELPVILDGKRGDIGSTAQAYAEAWLAGPHRGDALTVNPFLGAETLLPFVERARAEGGAVFVLVQTSNPGQADYQGGGVSERVAAALTRLGREELGDVSGGLSSVGAVVGATRPAELSRWRALLPHAPLLLPGLGAQGASAAGLAGAFLPGGTGAVVSASRGVQYAAGTDVDAAREAARGFQAQLNAGLGL